MHYSRSADAVIRVYDAAGNVIQNARAQGGFQGVINLLAFAEGLSFWLVL